jgi:RNA polymerase sigma-70 factor (ECF subfamily)
MKVTCNDPEDGVLLQRMASGDEEAFTLLYRRRQAGVYRFVLHMCGSTAVAEEIVQEVFLALIQDSKRAARQYDPERGSFAAYLYGMARHMALRRLERDRRYVPWPDEEIAEGPGGSDPLADLTGAERQALVQRAVLTLPPKYREVLLLCDIEEVSYAEAGRMIGCELGSVRSRLHRARALLETKLRAARLEGCTP